MYNNLQYPYLVLIVQYVCTAYIHAVLTIHHIYMHAECIDRMTTVTHAIGYPMYRMYTKCISCILHVLPVY